MRRPVRQPRLWLVAILLAAFALRFGHALSLDPLTPYVGTGGDEGWYLTNGAALVSGQTYVRGVGTDVSRLPTPPLYPLLLGAAQAVFRADTMPTAADAYSGTRLLTLAARAFAPNDAPSAAAVWAVRALQAVLGTAVCAFACGLARRLTGDARAGLIAAAILALSPAFILESTRLTSETVFMCLLAAGIWVFIEGSARRRLLLIVCSALLLGLAALTRAQLLVYPVGLAGLLVVLGLRGRLGDEGSRGKVDEGRIDLTPVNARRVRAVSWAAVFLLVYALTVGTWTAYNRARWQRWVIGGEGFAAFLYIGATGWESGQQVDQRLTQDTDVSPDQADFATGATAAMRDDTGGYLTRRVREWISAFTQPHGTEYFPGESVRALLGGWWANERTSGGLLAIARTDHFGAKLAIYGFHYGTLLAGLIGLWRTRRRWLTQLPMSGYLLYTALLHVALYALPRYVFPTFIFWAVFAAGAVTGMRDDE